MRNSKHLGTFTSILVDALWFSAKRMGMNDNEFRAILAGKLKVKNLQNPFPDAKGMRQVETTSQPIAALLREWQRSQKYQDSRGDPKSLPLRGPRQSLYGLMRSNGLQSAEEDVVRFLLKKRLIKKGSAGKFVLVSSFVPIDRLDNIAFQHAARGLDAFVGTLWHNLNTRRSQKLLAEKRAETAHLPRRFHDEFLSFSQRQLTAVANTIDDWLESKARMRKKSERCYSAGATVVSFSDAPDFRYRNSGNRASTIENTRAIGRKARTKQQ
jgi:hypothetical protein